MMLGGRNILKDFLWAMAGLSTATSFFPNAPQLRELLRAPKLDGQLGTILYPLLCGGVLLAVLGLRRRLRVETGFILFVVGIALLIFYFVVLSSPNQALIDYGIGSSVADYFDSPNQLIAGFMYYGIFASFTGAFGILASNV